MISAIIVSAGRGIRMGTEVAKQYLPLGGRPILYHTLAVFDKLSFIDRIFVVVRDDERSYCRKKVIDPFNFKKNIEILSGGTDRQDSVYNGLLAAELEDSLVIIHDGVRPFVPPELIGVCVSIARDTGACVPGIPAGDTLKKVDKTGKIEQTIPRNSVWQVQTPQVFRYSLIREAHEKARQEGFRATDDSQLVERVGGSVKIVNGSRYNMKITDPEDLIIADAILKIIPTQIS